MKKNMEHEMRAGLLKTLMETMYCSDPDNHKWTFEVNLQLPIPAIAQGI